MKIGKFLVQRIADIDRSAHPAARAFPHLSRERMQAHAKRLGPRFIDPETLDIFLSFHTYIVRCEGLTMLVDTCVGNDKDRPSRPNWHRRQGDFLVRCAAAGVKPEDVDIVMCTHLHADHVGWNTRLVNGRWVPTFPNARYLMAEVEYRYLVDKVARAGAEANHDCYPDSVLPVVERGQADLVSLSHRVAPGIHTEPAPGHTPGSVLVHLEDSGEHAVCVGDLMHHPLQMADPATPTGYCEDPLAAARRRVDFCGRYADTHTRVLTAHFLAPSAGWIKTGAGEDGAYRFEFDQD
ncbi:MAG: MBL fold metallo-hydrolase [Burkholderiales bacterium]|nr:MBL fold metallo-hydrolase [Burkholderiales bacterium]